MLRQDCVGVGTVLKQRLLWALSCHSRGVSEFNPTMWKILERRLNDRPLARSEIDTFGVKTLTHLPVLRSKLVELFW